jgi:trehalose-6-phosphate synthase
MEMPLAERKERWQPMFDRLVTNDVNAWCRSFLDTLRRTRVMARAS